MKPSDIPMCRLHNQQLEQSKFKKPSQLVSWLGAVQAQDYPGAKWSLGLRLPDSTDAMIEQAISEKKIVRTWLMRGTLHFVAVSDVRWMLELLAPRIIARNARRYRELELDEPTLTRSNEVLENALQDGKELSRRELLVILEQNGISTKGQRAAYMLQRASLDGLICQSVAIRNNPTYLSLNSLTRSKTTKPEDALVELAKRYFTTRGPATLQDYVWWSGLLVADARAGLEAVKSRLISETINGQTYWRPSSTPLVSDTSPAVYLLPGFDEFLLSYKDRGASLDTQAAKNVTLGNRFSPTIIIDGRVVGTWKRVLRKNKVIISSKSFRKFSAIENNALSTAKRRFSKFLGKSLYPDV
ncbi:MAG: winged helix DNA-binding domain-containing protein, partial [Methanobacteriaceae archaeon]|nr:winged helix DNA-binding domain-containing protein [Methanobacteriaceae archaeon]